MRELDFYAYETYCMVRIEERQDEEEILAGCRDLAILAERTLNMYDPESELSRLCRNYRPGEPFPVSQQLFHFLERNLTMAKLCGGAFDPTVGALVKKWGIGSGKKEVLKEEELPALLKRTGYRHLKLLPDRCAVMVDAEGITIDPGASGKGFAIDLIVEYLKAHKVCRACLDFGGNLYVLGGPESYGRREENRGQGAWKIAIRHPDSPDRMMAAVSVKDQAVSTSSWYEHYFEKNGEIYSHLINPATGMPAKSGLASVTVICTSAVCADILSTALYILGEEKGASAIRRLKESEGIRADYLLLDETGKIKSSLDREDTGVDGRRRGEV